MTAIITWAEGVISLAEPPIVSECLVSGSAVGSGVLLFGSPFHTTDGLNSLSKKMLGGDYIAFCADACQDICRLIIFPERLFKPSVQWEGESGNNNPDLAASPDPEHPDTTEDSVNEVTPSAHVIMAVIAALCSCLILVLRKFLPS